MDGFEKRMVEGIRDGFHDFEIPYEEGRWEVFQEAYARRLAGEPKRIRGRRLDLWGYAAAAVLLIGLSVVLPWRLAEKPDGPRPPTARQQQAVGRKERPEIAAREVVGDLTDKAARHRAAIPPVPSEVPTAVAETRQAATVDPIVDLPIEKAIRVADEATALQRGWKATGSDGMATGNGEGRGNRPEAAQGGRLDDAQRLPSETGKWKFGIELNPSLVQDRLAFGAGLLAQFEVSGKIKLSTGLTYARIGAEHQADSVRLSDDLRRLGGQSTINAIDIPLTFSYEPTERWYASVGVSALAVLDEWKMYRMESEVLRESVGVNPETGLPETVFEVVKHEYLQRTDETDFEGRLNLGYLNLSVGRKLRFDGRLDLRVEPFVKIPMGGLQRGGVNLLNTGIKFKVLF